MKDYLEIESVEALEVFDSGGNEREKDFRRNDKGPEERYRRRMVHSNGGTGRRGIQENRV